MLARLVPYDAEVINALLAHHHDRFWPAQPIVALVLVALLLFASRDAPGGRALFALGLAALWLWASVTWEWSTHGQLNWAGPWLAALLGVQALLLVVQASLRGAPRPIFCTSPSVALGMLLTLLGLLALALAGSTGTWSVALPPSPLVVISVGVALLCSGQSHIGMLVIPIIWSVYAASVAWVLGLTADLALLALALAGLLVTLWVNVRGAPRAGDGRD